VFPYRSSISNNVLAIRHVALSIEQGVTMLHGITRLGVYNHNTVYTEDALGWMLPIILDAQPSWEVSYSYALAFTIGGLTVTDCPLNTQRSICASRRSGSETCRIKAIFYSRQWDGKGREVYNTVLSNSSSWTEICYEYAF
jgi:hypothetical protein